MKIPVQWLAPESWPAKGEAIITASGNTAKLNTWIINCPFPVSHPSDSFPNQDLHSYIKVTFRLLVIRETENVAFSFTSSTVQKGIVGGGQNECELIQLICSK